VRASREEASALGNIGGIYERLGQPDRALDFYRQTLAIRQRTGEQIGQAIALSNIGSALAGQGQAEEARVAYEQALPLARAADDHPGGDGPIEATILGNLGSTEAELGRYDAALAAHEQALAIRIALGVRSDEALSRNNIGVVRVYLAQYPQASEQFRAALAIQREVGDAAGEAVTLSNIAYIERAMGQPQAALATYEQAIAIVERLRAAVALPELRASLAGNWQAVYAAAVEVLIELNRPAEAFDLAERGRARAMLDQLAGGQLDVREGADAELLAQEETLRADLARLDRLLRQERAKPSNQRSAEQASALSGQLAARQRAFDDLLARIKLSNPGQAALVSASPLTLAEVQARLPADATLVVYLLTSDQALAFVLSASAFQAVILPAKPAQIWEAVGTMRGSLLALGSDPPAAAAQLYAWLIAPIRKHLTTPLVGIVPHGVLHYLPFGALPVPASPLSLPVREAGGEGQHYLADDYLLFTLPSASALGYAPGPETEPASGVLSVAFSRAEGLPALRHADEESRAIAALFAQQPLTGNAATETALRTSAGNARYVHIAAHGQLNTANPLFSRLVLAPDGTNDGSLEVHEVYGLDLRRTDLVTLSACQTQLGLHSGGDDMVGLSRAFTAGAGAQSVVASLWSVDDEATAALMQAFYTGLRAGLGKAEALAAAQVAVRSDKIHPEWAQPYYWAAFTLSGDPGPVKVVPAPWWRMWAIGLGAIAVLALLWTVTWRARLRHTQRAKRESENHRPLTTG
jgi:CHAT domain-containing protein/Tfp pilus assembly protein PilF